MRALSAALLAATLLTACADADAPADAAVASESTMEAVAAGPDGAGATETADGDAAAASDSDAAAPGGLTDEQCRSVIGPKLTDEPLRLVAEQTFAISSPMYGEGCFLSAYDPLSLETSDLQMIGQSDVEPPYPYDYTVTDATGSETTTLAIDNGIYEMEHTRRLVAVSFPDLNADGTADILVVHNDCHEATAWTAFDDGWVHVPRHDGETGIPSCTAAEATRAYRAQLAEPVSP